MRKYLIFKKNEMKFEEDSEKCENIDMLVKMEKYQSLKKSENNLKNVKKLLIKI